MALRFGIISETESLGMDYSTFTDYVSQISNSTYEVINFSFQEFRNFTPSEKFHYDVDFVMVPSELSIFENRSRYTLSSLYDYSQTVIISGKPIASVKSSYGFVMMDDAAIFLFVLCAIIIAILVEKFRYVYLTLLNLPLNRRKRRSPGGKKLQSSKMASRGSTFWNLFSVILSEPVDSIGVFVGTRMLFGVWFLVVLILVIHLACYLKSAFSVVEFNSIDTLDDLLKSPETKPCLVMGSLEERYFNQISADNALYKSLMESIYREKSFVDLADIILSEEFYEEIARGEKSLIFSLNLWKAVVKLMLESKKNSMNLYFGRDVLKQGSLHIPINKDLPTRFLQLYDERFLSVFETQVFYRSRQETDRILEKHIWQKPRDGIPDPIKFRDMKSAFQLLGYLYVLAIASFVIETSWYFTRNVWRRINC